jgi:anti-sigma factor RsiW
MNAPVTEAELHAWVDGQLAPARRAAVDAYLSQHPAEAARLQAYRAQNAGLRALFQPVLDEPVPRACNGARYSCRTGRCAWPPCWR